MVVRPAGSTRRSAAEGSWQSPRLGTAVVAHRGYSAVAPQNTLAAVEAACRAGVDAVEIDLQPTAEGAGAVIHDETVDATTDGTGKVAALTAAQVHALDAGVRFAPAFAGQRVPALDDVLGVLARHPGTDLLLELKGSWGTRQVEKVAATIAAAGFDRRVLVQSFWPGTVATVRDVAPHLPGGLLVSFDPPGLLRLCERLRVVACNPSVTTVTGSPRLVSRLHDAGLRVMAWTANDPAAWSALVAAGVDAVITDRPERLSGWLAGRGETQPAWSQPWRRRVTQGSTQ
ncbi:glycerophosphodiester phosphodiesterase [Promicromonospora citrea]|uniref:Glycerophosphodiester phosphodiesterase n=1 Tax=Promicromonospora citrea TaxID=43677 RepID=A0A8H9GD18_9MICO|nr:glycerophosphodiester phosphodiesterase family protein [Promicromonospora citrea]NNH53815.1 glycerophosphodiester phosphodiesterase [Promicromonospora citrea]GGM09449.1 glycerophosphodiester phosphodiesterase [Promicromonospora citrea]HEV6951911.1 glycerophosphodiester phosphodiesterase family protein [Promicromonospora sp.]